MDALRLQSIQVGKYSLCECWLFSKTVSLYVEEEGADNKLLFIVPATRRPYNINRNDLDLFLSSLPDQYDVECEERFRVLCNEEGENKIEILPCWGA